MVSGNPAELAGASTYGTALESWRSFASPLPANVKPQKWESGRNREALELLCHATL
jgi:hypothetical protein